ncbi:DgyrCDS7078 [Dimorphilus gyrociliatus]|uniref:Tektin n=1 Tax=Dimorphilus gyrociliatus TaxID=2664684 RepID=A0A7I8VSM6_9ANNE|nr:DgyrCDS7078 [Dimorphilus gyrociliatus]
MEYLGQTQTASYMTGPRMDGGGTPTFLPSITTMRSSYKAYDTYPAPTPLRRSLTTLPWRPTTYYSAARVEPSISNTKSMPEPLSDKNRLTELDSIKVPPVFAAARNALYTRYTPNDWLASNSSNVMASDRVRGGSERLRFDTVRLCREADDKTRRAQSDVGKKLGERLGDIQFWKTEVKNETDNMVNEIDALSRSKSVLEKALAETENPLHIAQECLYNREKRQGIDLVHDNVERELIKEVDTIKRCQEKMRQVIDKANAQLALNRAAQHELEKDSRDKEVATNLDETCHGLRNTSRGIAFHDGIERVDNTVSVPETWAKFSHDNVARSQAERKASKDVRDQIEALLNECSSAMMNQWNVVNSAFSDRIKEYIDAKNKLQNALSKTLQEVFDMEKNIELLKKTITDKQAPLQVAQTRLATRTRRPNVEGCRDPVQHRLVEEVHEISETVEALQGKLREAENALQHLLRTKSSLEHDLAIKNNSLFIDREKCMGMRKTFPMSPRVVSY